MDFGIIFKVLGLLLLIESAFMLPPLGLSIYYSEYDTMAFLISIGITAVMGFMGFVLFKPKKGTVGYRESFLIVGLGWILASAFGALPFILSGTFDSFIDAYFETVSGFTTTGASVLKEVEGLPHGILFWRSFTHWLGGMGILVFTLAILPAMGVSTLQIFRAESPGPSPSKLSPKLGHTAKLLYGIYILITVAEVIALKVAGMPLFDAVNHTLATVGTGGFSTQNASVGAFKTPAFDWIIAFFMFASAANFSLYYDAIHGNFETLLKDREFWFYVFVVLISIILITVNINPFYNYNLTESIRHSTFQVTSVVTTTGFATVDYEAWPVLSKMILFLLMFIGGCSGSTGGAMKHIRILLVFKIIKREFYKLIHPNAVITVRVGEKPIPENILKNVVGFVLLYIIIFVLISTILLTQGMDIISSTSAVAATLGNIGPGFAAVGPTMNYSNLTNITKVLLICCMILGRLEIYTVLVLLFPAFWRT